MQIHRLLQPIGGQAGEHIKEALSSLRGPGSRLIIVPAWVKLTGLATIWNEVRDFREAGGHVLAIVGIDLRGTSKEALEHLIDATDEAHVFFDANPGRSFHPKFYLVVGEGSAVLLSGSGNLTVGGLYTNYELFDVIRLNLENVADRNLLKQVEGEVA